MKITFNGLSPWVLFKYYRSGGKQWRYWSIMWFAHVIYQSPYGTPFHPPEYYLGHKDPIKEKIMNMIPTEAPVTTVTDNEFAKLVAAQPVTPEFDADGNLVGYVTQDAEEPTAEDQIN